MLTDWARQVFRAILEPIAHAMQRLGFSPNLISLLGLGLQVIVAAVLATGRLQLGGLLLVGFSAFDAVDGTLARLTGQVTRFGAFLDATLDRYAESFILFGLLIHFTTHGTALQVLLIYITLVGSFLVSYTRAKAESLGLSCSVGILTRAERVGVLVVGLVLNGWQPAAWWPGTLTVALFLIAVLSNFTALQRVWAVWKGTAAERSQPGSQIN